MNVVRMLSLGIGGLMLLALAGCGGQPVSETALAQNAPPEEMTAPAPPPPSDLPAPPPTSAIPEERRAAPRHLRSSWPTRLG